MGLIQHHAVVATTWNEEEYIEILQFIVGLDVDDQEFFLFDEKPHINGYRTIVLVPDGSKEGWDESVKGDLRRNNFIKRLTDNLYWNFVEVSFGEIRSKIERDTESEDNN
jgi:hypothetical protein